MALGNYTELQASVKNWLQDRDDVDSEVVDFIAMAEAALNTRLRVAEMETTSDISPVSGLYAIPADCADIRAVRALTSTPVILQKFGNDYADSAYADRSSGWPQGYTVNGSSIRVYPANTADIELRYYQKIPALADNATNWLLTAYPQIYLYATLFQARIWENDEAGAQHFGGLLDNEINALAARDERNRYGGMAMRLRGVTP